MSSSRTRVATAIAEIVERLSSAEDDLLQWESVARSSPRDNDLVSAADIMSISVHELRDISRVLEATRRILV